MLICIVKVIIPSQFEPSNLKFLLRVFIEGPIDNSVSLRARTSNRARKPLKTIDNISKSLEKYETHTKNIKDNFDTAEEVKEIFSIVDYEASDESFYSDNNMGDFKESYELNNNEEDKENRKTWGKKKSDFNRANSTLDDKQKLISSACLIM